MLICKAKKHWFLYHDSKWHNKRVLENENVPSAVRRVTVHMFTFKSLMYLIIPARKKADHFNKKNNRLAHCWCHRNKPNLIEQITTNFPIFWLQLKTQCQELLLNMIYQLKISSFNKYMEKIGKCKPDLVIKKSHIIIDCSLNIC